MDFDFDDDELSAYLDQEMDGNTHTNNKNNHLNSVIMPMKKKNEKNYYTMKNDNSQRNDNGSNHQIIGNSQYRSNSLKQKVRVDTTKASTSKPPVLVNNKFIAPNSIIKRKKKVLRLLFWSKNKMPKHVEGKMRMRGFNQPYLLDVNIIEIIIRIVVVIVIMPISVLQGVPKTF